MPGKLHWGACSVNCGISHTQQKDMFHQNKNKPMHLVGISAKLLGNFIGRSLIVTFFPCVLPHWFSNMTQMPIADTTRNNIRKIIPAYPCRLLIYSWIILNCIGWTWHDISKWVESVQKPYIFPCSIWTEQIIHTKMKEKKHQPSELYGNLHQQHNTIHNRPSDPVATMHNWMHATPMQRWVPTFNAPDFPWMHDENVHYLSYSCAYGNPRKNVVYQTLSSVIT